LSTVDIMALHTACAAQKNAVPFPTEAARGSIHS
jgi:hypothetical protein